MKKLAVFLFALFALVLTNCGNDDDVIADQAVTATLTGAKQLPANASTATGTVAGTYNKGTKILKITVTYSGFTPTAAHIHEGGPTASGGVIFAFTGIATSPFTYTSTALTAAQETVLLAGNYYVNMHSAAFTGGEIRGKFFGELII